MYLRNFKKDETNFTTNYVVPAYAKYISGDRQAFITIDTSLTNTPFVDTNKPMSDWSFLFAGVSKFDTNENYNEMEPGLNSQIVFDFDNEQLLTELVFEIRKYKQSDIQFEYSDDKETWSVAGITEDTPDNNDYMDISIPLSMSKPSKHFRINIISSSDKEKGNINNVRFTNVKSGTLTKDINTDIDNSLLPAGEFNFDYASISGIDSSGNKRVRFNITDNTIDGTSTEYSPFSMTAQRLSSDNKTVIDSTVDVNGYLGVTNAAFFNERVLVKSYIQAGDSNSSTSGLIKLYDKNADGVGVGDWIDVVVDNRKLYLDGVEFTGSGVTGTTIEDNIPSTTTTYSSSKILEIIDDFEKVDSYMGAYYKTKDVLFDKYNNIDELLGKVYEGSATADEIGLTDILNNQLGLLASLDNDIVEYIDLKLGKK